MASSKSSNFRIMLVELAKQITSEEFNTFKYLCKDIIKARVRDKIKAPLELFEILEEKGKIKESDISALKGWLQTACDGRAEVLHIVESYEQVRSGRGTQPVDSDGAGHSRPQRQVQVLLHERLFLQVKLGREYRHFLRHLGVSEEDLDRFHHSYPRDIREVIHQSLNIWLETNRTRDVENLRHDLIKALRAEGRHDLATKILEKNFE